MLINEPELGGIPNDVWATFIRIAALASEGFTEEYLESLKIQREIQNGRDRVSATAQIQIIHLIDVLLAQVERVPDIVDKAYLLREIDEATEGLSI